MWTFSQFDKFFLITYNIYSSNDLDRLDQGSEKDGTAASGYVSGSVSGRRNRDGTAVLKEGTDTEPWFEWRGNR